MPNGVKVLVRCRARNAREVAENAPVAVKTQGNEVVMTTHSATKRYCYDQVLGAGANQPMVYEHVRGCIDELVNGFNCTIFAYGQTGTGKTYTMTGEDDQLGVIPRILHDLFNLQGDTAIKASFVELYNEELRDLIGSEELIKLYDTPDGAKLVGAEEVYLQNFDSALEVLHNGVMRRETAATNLNHASSRSHAVFSITLTTTTIENGQQIVKTGKLNLVDLAGSENASKSGSNRNWRMSREAGSINQSLLSLGKVITALVDQSPHVPYRESKLTRILRDSLMGGKTWIIATITPVKSAVDETATTLEYACRARNIKNLPRANETKIKHAHLQDLVGEINRLQSELTSAREQSGVFLKQEAYDELVGKQESYGMELETQAVRVKQLESETTKLRDQNTDSESVIDELHTKVEYLCEQRTAVEAKADRLEELLQEEQKQAAAVRDELLWCQCELESNKVLVGVKAQEGANAVAALTKLKTRVCESTQIMMGGVEDFLSEVASKQCQAQETMESLTSKWLDPWLTTLKENQSMDKVIPLLKKEITSLFESGGKMQRGWDFQVLCVTKLMQALQRYDTEWHLMRRQMQELEATVKRDQAASATNEVDLINAIASAVRRYTHHQQTTVSKGIQGMDLAGRMDDRLDELSDAASLEYNKLLGSISAQQCTAKVVYSSKSHQNVQDTLDGLAKDVRKTHMDNEQLVQQTNSRNRHVTAEMNHINAKLREMDLEIVNTDKFNRTQQDHANQMYYAAASGIPEPVQDPGVCEFIASLDDYLAMEEPNNETFVYQIRDNYDSAKEEEAPPRCILGELDLNKYVLDTNK